LVDEDEDSAVEQQLEDILDRNEESISKN